MKLYSYIVARDFGFAPNPFFGFCTLATCKPKIRASANVGDWIIGTGAKTRYGLAGRLIYAMQVSESLDFDSYWNDPRFLRKRPNLNGSLRLIYGDNIYHRFGKKWIQADSHHSFDHGRPNKANITWDTGVDRVLVATKFVYWGSVAPEMPKRFRPFRKTNEDICCRARGHRVFGHELASAFASWLDQEGKWGVRGEPLEFARHQHTSQVHSAQGMGRAARSGTRHRSRAR